jgi:hypothetical protein
VTSEQIALSRLSQQGVANPAVASVAAIVSRLGAMQAQDYPGVLWSIGLRSPNLTKADVEAAITNREIIRTWPMRGTLHFVPAADARWMLALLAPRMVAAAAGRRRALELDDATITKSRTAIVTALQGDKVLTRNALCQVLEDAGVATAGQRGIHILRQLCQEQLLCFGPHDSKQPTFVLLDEWVPKYNQLAPDEALAELTKRYFSSHGPAKLRDFIWWSSLTTKDAKRGLEKAKNELQAITVNGEEYWTARNAAPTHSETYLLPGFDEFMLGYQDRSAALPPQYANNICPGGNGMFVATIVINGQVRGTWKKVVTARAIKLQLSPFMPLSASEQKALQIPAERYAAFLQTQPGQLLSIS